MRFKAAGLRRFAAALLLTLAGPLWAHGGSDQSVQAELGAQSAAWDQITLQVRHSLAPQLLIANNSAKTVEILDQHGVPFVRIEPKAVVANLTASAWYNTYSTAGLSVPKKAHDTAAQPQWQQVSGQAQWGWFDPRLSTSEIEPPADQLAQNSSQTFGLWQIPALIDGQPAAIRGHYRYTPPQVRVRKAQLQSSGAIAEGVVVQLVPGPVDAFMLQNKSDKAVTVLGREGEPFLKIGPQAVQANLASPTWREWGRVELSAADSATQSVQWQRVAGGSTFTWLDPRSQMTDEGAQQTQWSIPLMLGEQMLDIRGVSHWRIPQVEPAVAHHDAAMDMDMSGMAHHDHASMAGIQAQQPLPRVKVRAIPDAVSGWNIHIQVENFRFAPEHVNQPHQAGEGHAHIYVDGKKVARVYGPWYHLALSDQQPHELTVELNANTHAALVHQGEPIAVSVRLQRP